MPTVEEIYRLNRDQKKLFITNKLRTFPEANDEIEYARNVSSILNEFISEYIDIKVRHDNNRLASNQRSLLRQGVNDFWPRAQDAIRIAHSESIQVGEANIYDLARATKLKFSNKVVRSLNSKMGLLWEKLASISPYAVNPEEEFGIKVKGIDLIIKNTDSNQIEYVQLKTQHNTLTGSQATRSREELGIHEYPVFAAAFSLGSWTFSNTPGIERVSGADFWSKIDIDYNLVCQNATMLIEQCESEYLRLLSES